MTRHADFENDIRADIDLVAAFRSGEDAAAAELYRRYYMKLVFGVATKLPSLQIAEDCVGNAFLKVLEIIRRGKGPTVNFYGYLRTAVVKESANFYLNGSQLAPLDEIEDRDIPQVPTAEENLQLDEPSVYSALETLPDDWRKLLILRYVENKKPAEIAEALHTTSPVVRQRLFRAKNGLRDAYLKQLTVSRSFGDCAAYSQDLVDYATGRHDAAGENRFPSHLANCSDCQQNCEEVKHQWRRVRPETLGLSLILVGIGVGSLGIFNHPEAANAVNHSMQNTASPGSETLLSTPTAVIAPKVITAGGIFQVLGIAGTVILSAFALANFIAGGEIVTSNNSPTVSQHLSTDSAPQSEQEPKSPKKTIITDDQDCELTVSVQNGTLRAEVVAHTRKCWFTYQRTHGSPRREVLVKTSWLVVTRVSDTHDFKLRSESDSKSYTVRL